MTITREVRAEAHFWRVRIDEGLNPNERREFDAWMAKDALHRELYAEACLIWHGLGEVELSPLLRRQPRAAPSQIETAVQAKEYEPLFARFQAFLTPQISAGALTAIVLATLIFTSGIGSQIWPQPTAEQLTFATEKGQRKIVNLPDGSQVTLGAQSELELTLSETQRLAVLSKGNAFFDVSSDPDRPFITQTELVSVEVTGTKFDVQLGENSVNIAVGEGAVEVSQDLKQTDTSPLRKSISLEAGQQINSTRLSGFGPVNEVFPAEFAAWRVGRLIYLRAELSEIVADLNRYSDQPIELADGIGGLVVSGTYDADDPAAVLDELSLGLPIRVISEAETLRVVRR
ncbi:MAG: FecR domain-containing protein [Pseudomonadota bacterium]